MGWFMAALVGMAGGASMEAIDIIKSIRWHRQMPWKVQPDTINPPQRQPDVRPGEKLLPAPGWKAYGVAGVLRLFVSGALAGVIAATYPQSALPLVSFLVGLGALTTVEKITSLVPLMVKSVGQAALGVVTGEVRQQGRNPDPEQSNGALPVGQQASDSLDSGAHLDTNVAAQRVPSDSGGAA